tara:strand:+ start:980 stop:1837 length:858 start_codon:yes stop_codon:yes gene_type:complete
MIFWIASYPKSGNTWIRALLSAYYYSKNGVYDEDLLKKIDQFPTRKYFLDFNFDKTKVGDTCQHWISAQKKINTKKELKFFKTHNVFGKVNSYDFTNAENSLGCIYIVRDPRNVFTSLKNHYDLDNQEGLKWMKDENKFIYEVEKFKENGFSDFTFISSWKINYISWKVQKKIPIKIIRYEDLFQKTFTISKEIIEFINKLTNNYKKINISKLKNAVQTTNFDKLKKKEINEGFSESVISNKNKNKKIYFFNLGPKNDWKKILDKNIKEKIENSFHKELKELSYK